MPEIKNNIVRKLVRSNTKKLSYEKQLHMKNNYYIKTVTVRQHFQEPLIFPPSNEAARQMRDGYFS